MDPRLYVFRGGCINGASNLAVITATQDHQEEDSGPSPTVTSVTQTHEEEEKDSPASEAVTLIDRETGSDPQEAEARSGNCLFKNTERGKPQNGTPQGPR